MDFKDCLTASCFSDQHVTSILALLIHVSWFSPAHVEVGGGAAYSYLHTGVKLWCAATRNSSSRLLERCYNDVASFTNLIQRGPRSREATFFTFHLQRPGNLIYIPPLRTHVVLTMNNFKPPVLTGWDAVYTRDNYNNYINISALAGILLKSENAHLFFFQNNFSDDLNNSDILFGSECKREI